MGHSIKNPYGKPGSKGNMDRAWAIFKEVPCKICGANSKTMTIDNLGNLVVECKTR